MRLLMWRQLVVVSLPLLALDTPVAWAGRESQADVVITGSEQVVVERNVSEWQRPEEKDFESTLDFLSTVLMQRADPSPDAAALRRRAVAAMAKARWKQAPLPPDSASEVALRSTWMKEVQAGHGFAGVLREGYWPTDEVRRNGIDAGIRAMLGKTGWLLSPDQSESIREMMANRKHETSNSASPPARFELKQLRPDVLYLEVPTFEDKDIGQRIVAKLREELTSDRKAILIDLRNNPGGQPEQANAVADLFLDRRPLQKLRFADGRIVTIMSRPGGSDVAIAVLVNRNTASAAEMLAMALRDNARATLVGERTAGALFGKEGVELSDGRIVLFRCEPTVLSPTKIDYAVRGIPPDQEISVNQPDKNVAIQETLRNVLEAM